MSRNVKTLLMAVSVIVGIWLVVWGGYFYAQKARMTAAKLEAYAKSLNFSKLSGHDRAEALRKLAEKINQLSAEERREWRRDGEWKGLFEEMTESEKSQFIDATMPTGVKQMLNVFEEMPVEKRKKAIDSAVKQLKENAAANTNAIRSPDQLSPELEKKAMTVGLKTFYSQSSAQTKAELTPFLEELQHQMQNGKSFHPR